MRLVTYLSHGIHRLGAWIDPYVLDIQGAISHVLGETAEGELTVTNCQSMLSLLQSGDEAWDILHSFVNKVSQDSKKSRKAWVDLGILMPKGDVQLLAPLPTPGKVICVAGNYPSPGINQKPNYPIIFLKPSSSITGPGMPIWLTDMTQNVAIEVELALVINKTAKHISIDDALSCVAGTSWQTISGTVTLKNVLPSGHRARCSIPSPPWDRGWSQKMNYPIQTYCK